MKLGQVVKYQSGKSWVVVMINDCRACIVPLGLRDMNNPLAVYDSSEQGATGISPYSDLEIVGCVKGRINKRVSTFVGPREVSPSNGVTLRPSPVSSELPGIPEDDNQDLMDLLTLSLQTL